MPPTTLPEDPTVAPRDAPRGPSTAPLRGSAQDDSAPGSNGKTTFRELIGLFRYVWPWRGRFTAAVIALLISMVFGLMFPFLVGHLLDAAIPSIKPTGGAPWMRDVNTVALALIGTLAAQAALTFFYSLSFHTTGERAVVALRAQLYERLISMPMKFYGERRVGELASRLSNDVAQLEDVLVSAVPQLLRQGMLFLGGIGIIMATSLRLSLVMISSFPVLMLLAVIFGRRIRKLSRAAQDCLADSGTIVDETLQGIANVKAFTNEAYETRRYGGALAAFQNAILRTAKYRAALIAFIILGIFGSIVLVLWEGARLMQAGQLTHGELTRFIFCTLFVGGSVSSFAEVFSALQKALGATQRVQELLGERTEISGSAVDAGAVGTARRAVHDGGFGETSLPHLSGAVAFEGVHFRYPSRPDLPVLRGLSLRAEPGEKIALVGPSGAGKSTIVSLLLRFYEPDSGRLLLDGRDARELDLAAVRGQMAIVPQEVLLFGGSIRENIGYGRPGATEAEIVAASRKANCHEFIERFPEGYETLVGERGVKLSGGQRQRIAIARALLKDPAVLILDEATSSLDSESEQLIQQALTTLLEGRTAFIIAHRLSTVRRVDRIYVIEEGAVTESGTHAELIDRAGGTYRRLSELQFAAA